MTSQANAETPVTEADASQVRDYLASHPDFFDDHRELLTELQLSHASGNAVSLIERQVQILRDQNQELNKKLLELVNIARDNDHLGKRLHQLTLGLIDTSSLTELVDKLTHQLCNEFNADAVVLRLTDLDESQQQETGAYTLTIDDSLKALLPTPLTENTPQCGRLKQAQTEFLFGEQANTIESCAIIPLGENCRDGLLVIGSQEAERFNPCMGTLYLAHLGELVANLLKRYRNQ